MVPVALVLALLAALAQGALGLAFRARMGDEPIPNGRLELEEPMQKLPNITTFSDHWNHFYANDVNRDKQPPSSVQIVFGFTTAWTATADAYWRVHKSTWMQQPGVCNLGIRPQRRHACTAYVTRVVGNSVTHSVTLPETKTKGDVHGWQFLEDDILFLNMTENGNGGKSFWLLHVLSRSCPWATHIAKMDPDAYPLVYGLADFLAQHQGCASKLQLLGVPNSFSAWKWGPARNLSASCTNQCFKTTAVKFMNGGMYMLSNELARSITDENGYFASNRVGAEDVCSGHAVGEYWERTGSPCISVWDGRGLFHHLRR